MVKKTCKDHDRNCGEHRMFFTGEDVPNEINPLAIIYLVIKYR